MPVSPDRIGIAIATFNSESVIRRCLTELGESPFVVVLFDDGSSDATVEVARSVRPNLIVLEGNGENWWAGSTRIAMAEALRLGVDYVVLLNPDVELTGPSIQRLAEEAANRQDTIVAPIVVDREHPDKIVWAGSRFGPLPLLPIYTSRYIFKRGTPVSNAGQAPYCVDEVHGRGTVISREVLEKIGTLDSDAFPHYGADNDLSLRAVSLGVKLVVLPFIRARLDVTNSGMVSAARSRFERLRVLRDYLTERKHGEALRVWKELVRRHVPAYARLPSLGFNLALGVFRRLVSDEIFRVDPSQ